MGAASTIICCLFLILLDPSVHCYNLKKLKSEDKKIAGTDEEKQQMKSLTGRKFNFGNEFGRRRKWDSFRTGEESSVVLWRRLLEDKEEPSVKKELEKKYKEAQGSSQNTTLLEDPKKETTPISELTTPSGVKLEVKDGNVEGLKAMEKSTTDNLEVNEEQKQLNDGTENDKGEWKSTDESADGTKENIHAGTTPGTSTEARKQDTQSIRKESALDLTEKEMQERESNQAEVQSNSGEIKTEIGLQEMEIKKPEMQTNSKEDKTEIVLQDLERNNAKMQINSTEVVTETGPQKIESNREMQTNSTDIGPQKTKSNGDEMQTNSTETTEIGQQKLESNRNEMQTNSTQSETDNRMQKIENTEVQFEMLTNSVDNKTEPGPQEIESSGDAMQTNSTETETDIRMQKIENTGVDVEQQTNSVDNKTEIGPQKIESNGDELYSNSTEAETDLRMQQIEEIVAESDMQTNSVDNITNIEMQKTGSNEGEMLIDSVDNKTKIGIHKVEDHEVETLKLSTEIQEARTGVTSSTDTRLKEPEPESETQTASKSTEAQNAIIIESREQAEPMDNKTNSTGNLESATNSRENKLEEAERLTNSTSLRSNNTEIREVEETLENSEESKLEKSSESTKENTFQSFSQTETKDAESLTTKTLNNSTDAEMDKEIDAEKTRNSEEEGESKSEEESERNSEEQEDLVQEFRELPWKLHDTAQKVADHLMPGIQKLSNKSKIYFNMANEEIAQGFQPLVGRHYAPFMAIAISCLFLLIPLFLTVIILDQIRTFLPLQKLIFLTNIYLANYFATLMFASFILAMEPMEFFYRNSPEGYIYLQLLQGLGYVVYLSLQCCNVVSSTANGSIVEKLGAGVQLLGALSIGLHYYVTVFHRAMIHKPPRTCWRVYAAYVLIFAVLSFFSRLRRGKKEYLHSAAHGNTHKKN